MCATPVFTLGEKTGSSDGALASARSRRAAAPSLDSLCAQELPRYDARRGPIEIVTPTEGAWGKARKRRSSTRNMARPDATRNRSDASTFDPFKGEFG